MLAIARAPMDRMIERTLAIRMWFPRLAAFVLATMAVG